MTFLNSLGHITGLPFSKRVTLSELLALRKQRRDLGALDTSRLQDIGLTEADVSQELRRSPFDLPCSWHK